MSILAKIQEAIRQASRAKPVFDPTFFGDPLAMKTDWGPLAGGGSNFRTHKGVLVRPDRYEFQATLGMRLFALVFGAVGGIFPLVFMIPDLRRDAADNPATLLILLFPAVFLGASWFLWSVLGRVSVFDKREGWYWKGSRAPSEDPSVGTGKHAVLLSDIRALQIIPEHVTSKNNSYTSWELNLVLADGSRRNVTDHGAGDDLIREARELGQFLSVPVWNRYDAIQSAV
ncbi:MAG: hypothetical protein H6686_00895 [Fibrobacteria bacterium]|nr:hypothetical protein [Fibrobacteria bacterium]